MNLAPPARLKVEEILPLGARVRYHHRAAVARWRWTGSRGAERTGEWWLVEGVGKEERPQISEASTDPDLGWLTYDPWYERPPRDRVNKTLVVWPAEGEGVLIGLVRRGIGESVRGSEGFHGYEGWEPGEPGSFTPSAFVPLYAVKIVLLGLSYILIPTWAIAPKPS